MIVLKRLQTSFRREIFTLIHELGHYLLNEEEVEQLNIQSLADSKLSTIEKWCNDFAFSFLIGDFENDLNKISIVDDSNDFYFDLVEKISKETHLSKIAIFTRLLYQNKLSQYDYDLIKKDFDARRYQNKLEEEKKRRDIDKQLGLKLEGRPPKPINSPLLISTIQAAFYGGVINEYDVCKTLNISADKLERYLY